MDYFDGFEGVAFAGDTAFFTIEAHPDAEGNPAACMVTGTFDEGMTQMTIDLSWRTCSVSPPNIPTISAAALIMVDDQVITLHEPNDPSDHPTPLAHA